MVSGEEEPGQQAWLDDLANILPIMLGYISKKYTIFVMVLPD
jgi:hypothetical protein